MFTAARLQNSSYFCVFKYGRAVKQKVWNEAENRERDWGETRFARVRLFRHALTISLLILRKKPTVLQSILRLNRNWSPQVDAENCTLYNAVSKRLHDGLARHLISLCGTYVLQMRQNEISTAFTDKTMLVFREHIFQFFINKVLTLKP